jgi:hypothetical protein
MEAERRRSGAGRHGSRQAERLTRSVADESWEAWGLGGVAAALASTDPDRAERIVHSLTFQPAKVTSLQKVAQALAATDPDRAERLAAFIPTRKRRQRR